jgi:hypothetical protein
MSENGFFKSSLRLKYDGVKSEALLGDECPE